MSDILSTFFCVFFSERIQFSRTGEGRRGGGRTSGFERFLRQMAKILLFFPLPENREAELFQEKQGKMNGAELRKRVRHDTFPYSLFALG